MQEYAQNPNAIVLGDRIRIYFTCRPKRSEDGSCTSRISFIDVDKDDPSTIFYVHSSPVIELGGIGDFDEFGTMPGSVVYVKERDEYWLYYVGWTRQYSVPYKWSIGLAISNDGGYTFKKYAKGPIITSTPNEPYLHACPRVHNSGSEWQMWYQSGLEWYQHEGKMESVYTTMFASSDDGINWKRDGVQVIPSRVEKESQTSASVFFLDDKYHMYFSYRHGTDFRNRERGYRIGYAWSHDGRNWSRDDSAAGITLSESGWDSGMICYPNIVKVQDRHLMFYCGNYFGQEGFGYAILESN